MALILCIDTAIETASICLARDEELLAQAANPQQKDSASWLHLAIQELMAGAGLTVQELDAVAVGAGPGSYTGLRVGMAAAKGLCFALNLPLYPISTLKMMALAALDSPAPLLCPMIDARRMEVFTALYDHQLAEKLPATNLILDENSFRDYLDQQPVCFFGNGSTKFQSLIRHPSASFMEVNAGAAQLASLALEQFRQGSPADLAYATPFYGKDFHSSAANKDLKNMI